VKNLKSKLYSEGTVFVSRVAHSNIVAINE